MKFKFSVFNLTIAITFLLAFVCILLSYITLFMYYPATILFAIAFIMLSVSLIKNFINQKSINEEKQDAIIMELAMGEDGEKYVMQDEKTNKKMLKQKRRQNIEKLLPSMFSIAFSCLFIYLFISSIIKLF